MEKTLTKIEITTRIEYGRKVVEEGQTFNVGLFSDAGHAWLDEPYLFYVGPSEFRVVPEEAQPEPDPVNSPPHYVYGSFEVIDILDESFPDDPHLWAAGKYLLRAKRKGNEKQDLEKAIFFIKRRIECLK